MPYPSQPPPRAGSRGRGWRGLQMAKASWAVLKQQPTLLTFPIISGIALMTISAAIAVLIQASANANVALSLGLAVAWYLGCAFVVIFFNAALVACALQFMAGQKTSVGAGFAAAFRRLPQIFGWALIATTVGTLLQILQTIFNDKLGFIGAIMSAIVNTAWAVVTYFVVPVLVVEGVGPIKAIKRSSAMLRRMWGESLTGAGGLGLIQFLLTLPAIGLVYLATKTDGTATVALGAIAAIYVLVLIVLFSTLNAIFRSAVYTYGTTGRVPWNFDPALVQRAFRSK